VREMPLSPDRILELIHQNGLGRFYSTA